MGASFRRKCPDSTPNMKPALTGCVRVLFGRATIYPNQYAAPSNLIVKPIAMTQDDLLEAINQTMPFGKYKGRKLLDLPEPYLVWFYGQGFPKSKLGRQLALMHEIKVNGLEGMLEPLLKGRFNANLD